MSEIAPEIPEGTLYGPNDGAYLALGLARLAPSLIGACHTYCGYSHHRSLTEDSDLVKAIKLLENVYREHIQFANEKFDPALFAIPKEVFVTPEEHWAPYQGQPGSGVAA